MGNEHTYGLDEWQTAQLRAMPVPTLEREHAATTVDDYRDKLEAEFKLRGMAVPDVPAPKPKRRRTRK